MLDGRTGNTHFGPQWLPDAPHRRLFRRPATMSSPRRRGSIFLATERHERGEWQRGRLPGRSGRGPSKLPRGPRNVFPPLLRTRASTSNERRRENERCLARSDSRRPSPEPARKAEAACYADGLKEKEKLAVNTGMTKRSTLTSAPRRRAVPGYHAEPDMCEESIIRMAWEGGREE